MNKIWILIALMVPLPLMAGLTNPLGPSDGSDIKKPMASTLASQTSPQVPLPSSDRVDPTEQLPLSNQGSELLWGRTYSTHYHGPGFTEANFQSPAGACDLQRETSSYPAGGVGFTETVAATQTAFSEESWPSAASSYFEGGGDSF